MTNVFAGATTRKSNIKSHGVFVGQSNTGDEVVLNATDLYYLADQLDVLEQTIKGLSLQQNASIEYVYHSHKYGNGTAATSSIIYATTNPGGCYRNAGHTHNKTGTCSYTTTTTNGPHYYVATDHYDGNNVYKKCIYCGNGGYSYNNVHEGASGSCSANVSTTTTYTCGSPTNTWKINCGKTTSSIDEAHIVFN